MLYVCVCWSSADFTRFSLISYGPRIVLWDFLLLCPREGEGLAQRKAIFQQSFSRGKHPESRRFSWVYWCLSLYAFILKPILMIGTHQRKPWFLTQITSNPGNKEKCYYCWSDNLGFTWGTGLLEYSPNPLPWYPDRLLNSARVGQNPGSLWQVFPRKLVMFSSPNSSPWKFCWNITFVPVKLGVCPWN